MPVKKKSTKKITKKITEKADGKITTPKPKVNGKAALEDHDHIGVKVDFTNGIVTKEPAESGAMLLDDIVEFIRRFVILSLPQAVAIATWIVHTHLIDASDATPYLAISSAEKRSGKTRLLEVLELLVLNPWLTGRTTPAALVRKLDAQHPVLLLDESDAAFNGDPEYSETLRGVLNSGARRGGSYSCCVGQGTNIGFRDFSTFGCKGIAGLGKLPDTVADRSIPITLTRKLRTESVERFRRRDVEPKAISLKNRIAHWAAEHLEELRDARPELPTSLDDRAADGAEPLLAIADRAGGEWGQKLRAALVELFQGRQMDDDSAGTKLLSDVRDIFNATGADKLTSAELVAALVALDSSPWAEFSKGDKPITPARLAKLVRPFGITSRTIRIDDRVTRGYAKEAFRDSWERYLAPVSPLQSATVLQPASLLAKTDFSKCNTNPAVALPKSASNPHEYSVVAPVALSNPDRAPETAKTGAEGWCPAHGYHPHWWPGTDVCAMCHPDEPGRAGNYV